MRAVLLLAALLASLAGCASRDGPDLAVQAYNDSAEPVEVRFRITMEDGSVQSEVEGFAPPGYSVLGHVGGSRGDYLLEAWALGGHAQVGPLALDGGSQCSVYVSNPEPVRISCAP